MLAELIGCVAVALARSRRFIGWCTQANDLTPAKLTHRRDLLLWHHRPRRCYHLELALALQKAGLVQVDSNWGVLEKRRCPVRLPGVLLNSSRRAVNTLILHS